MKDQYDHFYGAVHAKGWFAGLREALHLGGYFLSVRYRVDKRVSMAAVVHANRAVVQAGAEKLGGVGSCGVDPMGTMALRHRPP